MITKENLTALSALMARQQKELEDFIKAHDMWLSAETKANDSFPSNILLYNYDVDTIKQFEGYEVDPDDGHDPENPCGDEYSVIVNGVKIMAYKWKEVNSNG